MGGFDAEGYLRALGAKQLADEGRDSPFAGPVDHAAAALVAVGVISADEARRVLADYASPSFVGANAQDDPGLERCRVVALDANLRLPSGTLRLSHARLDDGETAIVARYRADPKHAGVHHDWIRVPSGWPSGLRPLQLVDAHGTKATLAFDGSGNDDRWRATLRAEPPIAPDSAWIELCGTRISWIDDGPEMRIAIEPLPAEDPAHAHLWRCMAEFDPDFDRFALKTTVDALIASGALRADDPVLKQAKQVQRQLPRWHSPQTKAPRYRALPEPWRSVIHRRGTVDGPAGMVLIAAVTPVFAGHRVAVDVLESFSDGFAVAVRESPTPVPVAAWRGSVEDQQLVWWARDDRGNQYLGARQTDGVRFTTPLDPQATTLELMPTATHCRAVISFPLRWLASPHGRP